MKNSEKVKKEFKTIQFITKNVFWLQTGSKMCSQKGQVK
jgi:hypothetical protein